MIRTPHPPTLLRLLQSTTGQSKHSFSPSCAILPSTKTSNPHQTNKQRRKTLFFPPLFAKTPQPTTRQTPTPLSSPTFSLSEPPQARPFSSPRFAAARDRSSLVADSQSAQSQSPLSLVVPFAVLLSLPTSHCLACCNPFPLLRASSDSGTAEVQPPTNNQSQPCFFLFATARREFLF